MNCSKCGKLIANESIYCNYCGNKVEVLKNKEIDKKTTKTKIESKNSNVQDSKNSINNKKANKDKQSNAISSINSKRPVSIIALIAISIFFILILIPFFRYHTLTSLFWAIFGVSIVFTITLFILIFANKQPRKRWFKIFSSIAFGVSIVSMILAISFSPKTVTPSIGNIPTKDTLITSAASEITLKTGQIVKDSVQETLEVETTSPETTTPPETTANTVSSEPVFSFNEYIDSSKVREYRLVKSQDISIANNFRMKYCITVPRDITEEELQSTLAQIIKDKSTANLDIDEIFVAAWYDEAGVEKSTALAISEWCPNGEWGEVSSDIADNNIRDSYLIIFRLNSEIKEEEVKNNLTEQERKQIFYDTVLLEDKIPIDDPDYDEKMDNVEVTIANKYGITIQQVKDIGVEGVVKGWPMPPLE